MKKPIITKRLKLRLNELHNSRNEIEEFSFNFLSNIYRHSTLMHKLIEFRLDSSLLEVAVSQYVSSLVASVTLDTYSHGYMENKVNQAQMLDNTIFNNKVIAL